MSDWNSTGEIWGRTPFSGRAGERRYGVLRKSSSTVITTTNIDNSLPLIPEAFNLVQSHSVIAMFRYGNK